MSEGKPRRASPQRTRRFQGLTGCVVLSPCPVSASGSAAWGVPTQKDILEATVMPGPPQHAPPLLSGPLWCLALFSLRMSSLILGKLTSAGAVCGRVLSVTSHKQPWPWGGGHWPLHWELCLPTHLFYYHDRTSHRCSSYINLPFSSRSLLLSFVNKHQRYLNSSTWGSKSPPGVERHFSTLRDVDLHQPLHPLQQSIPTGAEGHWCQFVDVINKSRFTNPRPSANW